ncbi:GNAT family N-acetyltransferase [Vibrio vulnificus]|uniref:GNAT family N-acetyltransferase n=1 Tax=Vibrio vulnificus TaxID=672 RepID=UPI001A2F4421|nr:N-acetyltransferase [Vibrio vulnificus]
MHYTLADKSAIEAIKTLFCQTFTDSEGEAEGQLIGQLASDLIEQTHNDDLCIYIAAEGEAVVGAILFTRLHYPCGTPVFVMAPVAVATSYHGQGIGQALIAFGLQEIKAQGVEVAVTYGDPNFYHKAGFVPVDTQTIAAPYSLQFPHGWQAQSLTGEALPVLKGPVTCVAAFCDPQFW